MFHKLSVKQKKQSKLWKRTSLKSAASFIRKRLDEQLAQLEQLEASEEFKSSTSSASSASIIARRPRPIDARKLNQERKAQVDQLLRIRRPGSFGRCWIWSRRLQVTAGRVMRQTLRAREALFAQFGLSLVSLLLFYFCIGGSPRNVRIAVVNQETDPQFSVEFLSHLNPQMIRTVSSF